MAAIVHLDRSAIELLAYFLWEYRGRPLGTPDRDWYRAEEILAYKAQYQVPPSMTCGIDDVATGGGATAGSTFFVLPTSVVSQFSQKAAALLPPGLTEFHGCEMRPGDENAFEAFLELARDFLELHPYSYAGALGADRNWQTEFGGKAGAACVAVLNYYGVSDPQFAKRLNKLSQPLWSLSRLLRLVGHQVQLTLDIDSDSFIASLVANTLSIGATVINGEEMLARLSNSYAASYFGDAPRLAVSPPSLRILPSQQSFMVQAADVVGNFALAHASYVAGLTTGGRKKKSEILQRVFGAQPTSSGLARVVGPNDIEPTAAGNLKFQYADHFYKSDFGDDI
jgi:Protein of unknown function (DUF2934)